MRNEKDLEKIYEECRLLMVKLGYEAKPIGISLNSRLTSTLGRYFRKQNRIEISKNYYLHATDKSIRNTIIHEICHQVCREGGHGRAWRRVASDVSIKTPYKIQRLATEEEVANIPRVRVSKQKRYGVTCSCCGKTWEYVTKTKAYKNPKSYSCPYCKTKTLISVDL